MAEHKIENQVKKWGNIRMKIGQKMTEYKNENWAKKWLKNGGI